jgi:hypothetical protein
MTDQEKAVSLARTKMTTTAVVSIVVLPGWIEESHVMYCLCGFVFSEAG